MSSEKFLRGAAILAMAGLMVKVIGSFNRILLSRLLGGEGIGLYQMAYPVYLLILAVSSAGIPVAISIIVAEKAAQKDFRSVRRIFKVSLLMMAATGLLFAAALFAGAGWLVQQGIISDSRAYYGLIALTPAVFFSTILACFRGFFQGHQLMTPPAVSQILEQLVRVMTMVILAYYLLPYGLEYAAAGAAFGAVPGGITGLIVLSCFYFRYRHRWQDGSETASLKTAQNEDKALRIVKRLLLLALPVSCANIMVPITSSIDMLLVPNRLIDCGFAIDEATALFGYLAGMAQPLLMMATIPTMSLASSLVPAVSEAHILGDSESVRTKAVTAMKLCCLLTLPAAAGMSALAEPISLVLYGTAAAGNVIMHLGPAVWLLGMHQVTTGILQGIGIINVPMFNMLAGITAKMAAVWFLTNELYNIAGAAWATNINFAVAVALNIFVLAKYKIGFQWYNIFKIGVSAVLMGIFAHHAYAVILNCCGSKVFSLGSCIVLSGIFYGALLLAGKVITKQELHTLPLLKRLKK